MAGGLSFLGRSADDTSLSPEMQAWLAQQAQSQDVPAAVPPGYSGYNAPTAPAAADPNKVLTPLGRKWADDLTNVVTAPQRAWTGELQVWDPMTGHTTQEAQDAASGMAGLAMTGGLGGVAAREGEAVLGSGPIRAYHGSPHDFDRFDISKLGTGEGAQAYGHGLYFAGNEAVARSYRDALSPASMQVRMPDGATAIAAPSSRAFTQPIVDAMQGVSGPDYMKHSIVGAHLEGGADGLADRAFKRAFGDRSLGDQEAQARAMISSMADQAQPVLSSYQVSRPGRMYEVGIDADPAKLLNWDAPVSSQPRIRDLAGDMGARLRSDATGGDAYAAIRDKSPIPGSDMGGMIDPEYGSPAVAAQRLREMGVPGIKYLDGGSRGFDSGGSHNYVTFSDDIVSILRKYGLAGMAGGGAAAGVMAQPGDAQAATPEPLPFLGRR